LPALPALAILHGLDRRLHIAMPGDEDHREVRVPLHQLAQEGCAVHARQANVGHDNEAAIARQRPGCLLGAVKALGAHACERECLQAAEPDVIVVLDYQDLSLLGHQISPLAISAFSATRNCAPPCGLFSPQRLPSRLDRHEFQDADIEYGPAKGHDQNYARHVRQIHADTPARFNADAGRLHEASGCAGKLILFAVRLDTFPAPGNSTVFYIGTNDPAELEAIRRHALTTFSELPISGEYLHRDAFDVARTYGKDTFLAIRMFGTPRIPALFALKARIDLLIDALGFFPASFTDRVLQVVNQLFPEHLPPRLLEFRDKYEHHLLLKVEASQAQETQACLDDYFRSATGGYFICTDDEGDKAFLHRFAAAGAAIRYRAVHAREVEDIVALDIALRRNDHDWFEHLPADLDRQISIKLYYGHFLCHVLHQDYIVKKGCDTLALEHAMWKLLDARGAEYPAEHNVGHLYHAKPALRNFYRSLDPCNQFNPGIGQTSKMEKWKGQD